MIFFISKACILIAPIFAASVISKESYGLIEWALSLSMISSSIFSFGSGNTIAFENLKSNGKNLVYFGQKYSMLLCVIFLILTLMLTKNFPYIGLISGISSIFVIQYALSARLKSDGKGALAGLVDSSFYILLIILTLIISVVESENIISGYAFSIIGFLLLLLVYFKTNFKIGFNNQDIKKYFSRGLKIVMATTFSLIFFNLPKIFLGNESLRLVAEFSLYFRWSSIAIIVYRFFSLVYFKDLYTMDIKKFDKSIFFISIITLIFGFSILSCLAYINNFRIDISGIPQTNFLIQFFLINIISLWCISGSLEGLIYREKKPLNHFYATAIGIFFFVASLTFFQNYENNLILNLIQSWLLGFIAIIFFQIYFLKNEDGIGKNLKYIKMFVLAMLLINIIILISY